MARHKKHIILPALLLIILSALFFNAISGENLFLSGDSLSSKSIKYAINSEVDKNGEYPHWLPWIFSGIPSSHSMQNVSNFYIPNYIISLLHKLGMPWIWNYILHYIFCGIGMFFLLKRLKISKNQWKT